VKRNIFSLKQNNSKFRLAAIAGTIILGLSAIFFGLSIAAALFDLPFFIREPGGFFVRAFGVMAFIIPAYLFWASYTLADPAYKADKLFLLCVSIIPLITLAFGFGILRNFDVWQSTNAFFAKAGKIGFTAIVLVITIIECLIIAALKIVFLKNETIPSRKEDTSQNIAPRFPNSPLDFLKDNQQEKTLRVKTPSETTIPTMRPTMRDVYTESASHIDDVGLHPADVKIEEKNKPTFSSNNSLEFNLPEPKPLASKETFKKLDLAPIDMDEDLTSSLEELENLDFNEEDMFQNVMQDEQSEEATSQKQEKLENHFEEDEISEDADYLHDADNSKLEDEIISAEHNDLDKLDSDLEMAITAAEIEAEKKTRSSALEKHSSDEVHTEAFPVKKRRRWGVYEIPVEGILNQYPDGEYWIIDQVTRDSAIILKETLKEFNIQAEVTGIRKGPVITMFEILPAPGVKLSKIVNLQDNIALRLAASSVRIVAPIPGKHAVGIEVPNNKRSIVSFREIIEGELKREGKKLEIPVILGKDITGEAQTLDLVQTPHLLIAGSTGSGKSVCVNSIILSILYQLSPQECRLMLIDPKIVELKLYNDIPHLLTPVITEPKKAFQALQYCIYEMERRYACLDSMGVRDIRSYNRRIKERNIATERLPYIVVIIDEFADLMSTTGKELESTVARLAAMSRAVGIHIVLATQRPSIDVITGLIKANIPSRIAFMVASKMDSRIIIDMVGAEKLLGRGDMLYAGVVDPFPIRIQGAFVSEEEIERVVEYVKTLGEPDYIDDEIFFEDDEDSGPSLFSDGDDPLYEQALEIVMSQGKASASYIQRRLKIGYNRSARLVEEMEERGIVGPAQGSKPRELLRGL
jgi:S-DNA-T family DNA segregation ATPase FtsK/SpoIIIE